MHIASKLRHTWWQDRAWLVRILVISMVSHSLWGAVLAADRDVHAYDPNLYRAQIRAMPEKLSRVVTLRRSLSEHEPDKVRELRSSQQRNQLDLSLCKNDIASLREVIAEIEPQVEAWPGNLEEQVAHTDAVAAELVQACPEGEVVTEQLVSVLRGASFTEVKVPDPSTVAPGDPGMVVGGLTTSLFQVCRLQPGQEQLIRDLESAVQGEYYLRKQEPTIVDLRAKLEAATANMNKQLILHKDLLLQQTELQDALTLHTRSMIEQLPELQEVVNEFISLQLLAQSGVRVQLSQNDWCILMALGGVAEALAQTPTADARLRDAAAAWGGSCHREIVSYLDLTEVALAWSSVLSELARTPVVNVQFRMDEGLWTLDGTPIHGFSVVDLALHRGTHRIERVDEARHTFAVLTTFVEPDDHLMVQWVDDAIQILPLYPQGADVWVPMPVAQAPPPIPQVDAGPMVPEVKPERPLQRPVSIGVEATWLRFDGRDHGGLSMSVLYHVQLPRSLNLELGLAHDQLASNQPYAYSQTLSANYLLRERAVGGLNTQLSHLRAGVRGSLGVVPPANALAWQLEGRTELRASDALTFSGALGFGALHWAGVETTGTLGAMFGFQLSL